MEPEVNTGRSRQGRTQPRISLCMIVRDEAKVLARCLESLKGCYDEWCVVDTGSADGTPELAVRLGAKVASFTDCNGPDGRIADFAKARNAVLAMATGDWILQIDADEILESGADRIRRHSRNKTMAALAIVMRSGASQWKSCCMYRREAVTQYQSPVHEYLEYSGPTVIDRKIVICNQPDKTGKEASGDRNTRLCLEGLRLNPEDSRLLHYLGIDHEKAGRLEQAIECYQKSLHFNNYRLGNFYSAYYTGICNLLLKRHEEALSAAFTALKIDPRRAEVHCLLGDLYLLLKQYDFARQWYKSAIACRKPPPSAIEIHDWAYGPHPRKCLHAIQRSARSSNS